jgi:hypothetical protein
MNRLRIGVVIYCLLVARPAFSAELKGIVYDLESLIKGITTQDVDINVYDVQRDPKGVAIRDPKTLHLKKGDLLDSTAASRKDGSYNLSVPPIPGQDRRLVIVEFNRRNFAATQLLDGVVLDEKRPTQIDVAVPEPLQPSGSVSCVYCRYPSQASACSHKHKGFFGRVRCR